MKDLEDAIEIAMQFESFVKIMEECTKCMQNTKAVQQDQQTKSPKQRVQVPQKGAENSQQDVPKPDVVRDHNPTLLS